MSRHRAGAQPHCPCAFSSDPGPPDGPAQKSFVHSQLEVGNLHGLEKRYRERRAFEDHPPAVVTIPDMQGPHRWIMPSPDSGAGVAVVSSLR